VSLVPHMCLIVKVARFVPSFDLPATSAYGRQRFGPKKQRSVRVLTRVLRVCQYPSEQPHLLNSSWL